MRKIGVLFFVFFIVACTSNTIYKEPANLIPKDSMLVVIEDLIIASSSSHIKNKYGDININYLPVIREKYQIDSARFCESNIYYASKIDLYVSMLSKVKKNISLKRDHYKKVKRIKDSLQIDSLKKIKNKKLDSVLALKDTLKRDSLKQLIEKDILQFEKRKKRKVY